MVDTDSRAVTVLGLGAMGSALAGALLDAGHPTTVWNRTAAKADPLVARGAVRAGSIADAVAASPLVIVCLLDEAAVRQALAAAGGALSGRTVVNLTNGDPDQARALAASAADHGAGSYLDGGIMAVPEMIGGPYALVLYSGSSSAFARHEPVLSALGEARFVGDDPGLAPLLDLALLSGMYGMFAGFLQAVALAGVGQVPAGEFTATQLVPWLQAMTGALPELARQVDTGSFESTGSGLAMQTPAVRLLLDYGQRHGVSGALLAPMLSLMHQRVTHGGGNDDVSSLVELIRKA